VFENYPMGQELCDSQDDVMVKDMVVEGHTHYPLTLDVIPGPATTINFIFDRTRIKAEMVSSMLKHFRRVLEEMVAAPGRRLGDVTVLSPAEVAEQTRTWNETAAAYPADESVADLFEAQAARTPAAVAVQCGPTAVTYAELDARAEQVAQGLVATGVGPDTVVAVLAERDVEWVTVLLGILKAGAGYLPLDPTHPAVRWRQILT
jgi:non-ribosomal peptide synthetase component F